MMTEPDIGGDRLYHDADLVQFYDLENAWEADTAYCSVMAEGGNSVLDLGCGTGVFLASLPHGKLRCGVDAAQAMLNLACARPGGEAVQWICGDARTIRLHQKFDLVVLTGHAFQAFLTTRDRRAVLETIAAHLTPAGQFIFDTRNPLAEEWRGWTPSGTRHVLDHPDLGPVTSWIDVSRKNVTGIIAYETHYRVETTGTRFAASSMIAFPRKTDLAQAITEAGLEVEQWLGDWEGNPYGDESKEIIPVGGLKR